MAADHDPGGTSSRMVPRLQFMEKISGKSRPSLKQLQFAKITTAMSSKWYELGIALLDDNQVRQLKVIKADSGEVTRRCSAMLSYWLETHPDVTWNDLVAGFRAPGVEMNKLAATIEKQFAGDSRPTLKQLQFAKISTAVSSKWYELGIALLDDDQVGQLKVIKADSDELTRQCSEMLSYWLETHSDVTWNDLVAGLRAPGVEMNELATTIEGQLTDTAPTFTTPPSPQSVNLTQTATFTCSATGDDVKYQWTIGSGSFPSKVTGINTNILVIPDVRSSDDNTYSCTISSDGGSVTSDPVQLTVTVTAPTFTTPPSPQSVDLTQTATFTCSATGDDVKYQWTIGSGSFPSKVTGINTNTLVIPDVRSSDDNTYSCTISNDGGSVTSDPVKLTVTGLPKLNVLPSSQSVNTTQSTKFTTTVSGIGVENFTYQWQHNGVEMNGETGDTLNLTNITGKEGGSYQCIVKNQYGYSDVSSAELIVTITAPTFTTPPSPQSADLTQTATFTCSATGDDVKYQWTIGSGSFPSKVTGINTNTLVIPDVWSSDDNTYSCTISNDGGSVTSDPVQLTVTGLPPDLAEFNRYIRLVVASKWHDLGVQLKLDVNKLNTIKANHPGDVEQCCTEMYQLWTQSDLQASQEKLAIALQNIGFATLPGRVIGLEVKPTNTASSEVNRITDDEVVKQHTEVRQEFTAKSDADTHQVDFHQFSSVSRAFICLTSKMTKLLRVADFSIVRRACIEQINTPDGAQLTQKDVDGINESHNIDVLLDILARSPYWSWIDVRLLETMAVSSDIKQADILLESYKKVIFTKKLKDLLPNSPSKEIKEEYYQKVVSKLNKDPNEVTVHDLLEFRQQLEKVIMDIKNGLCILEHLERGCIELYWYIPTCCIDHAYQSALQNCDQFKSIGLQHLQIGNYPVIYDPSISHQFAIALPVLQVNTVKSFINHYYDYLSVNMDAEVVVQLMISQQLLTEDIVMTAQSLYNKNCLILERVQYTDGQTLVSFCETLKANTSQKQIGEMLLNAFQSSNSTNVGEQDNFTATTGEIDKGTASNSNSFEPSSLVVKFSGLKIQLTAFLQSLDSKIITNQCGSLRASVQANIPLFPTDFVKVLKESTNAAAVLRKIALFTNWSDHSILNSIVEVCNVPKAVALLTQFDADIDTSQPLMKYPIPAPSHHMVPYDTSTHTVLAVQLNLQLQHSTLQSVIDTRSLIQEKCEVTPHCLQLLAVAKTSHTIIYWTIPKHVASLITSKVQQYQSDLHQNGIQQVSVYPGTIFVTAGALTVGPFLFFTKVSSNTSDNVNTQLYQLEEIPKVIDRVQTDLQQKLHKKIFREKEKYFILLEKFEKLQVSQSTDKSSQLLLDTSQQEDHDKSEEPQTPTRLLDKDTMTKPSKVVLQMEDVSVIREKFEAIWKYWMEQTSKSPLISMKDQEGMKDSSGTLAVLQLEEETSPLVTQLKKLSINLMNVEEWSTMVNWLHTELTDCKEKYDELEDKYTQAQEMITQKGKNKVTISQLTDELPEKTSQLVMKENELGKVKEDNKLLQTQLSDSTETITRLKKGLLDTEAKLTVSCTEMKLQQEVNKFVISQLNSELSESTSQLMLKDNELTKVKEYNKLLEKQFRERKDKKRRETIPQDTQKKISLLLDEASNKETSGSHKSSANTDHLSVEDVTEGYMDGELLGSDVRVALFGAEGSGKTCLSHTLVGKDYQNTPPTKGVDHMEIAVQSTIDWRPLTNKEKLDELEQQKCLEAMFVSATKQKQRSIFAPDSTTTSSFASSFDTLSTSPGDVPVSSLTMPTQALSLYPSPQALNHQQSSINSSNTICHASEAYFSLDKLKTLRDAKIHYNPNKKYIRIWDFAGQEIFQHTNGMFVSEEVVCLIVFDASLALHEVPERRYSDDRTPRRTVLQTICYWMELISSRLSKLSTCDKDHSVRLPTFILVGTHIDKLHHDMAIAEMIAFEMLVPLFKKELLDKPFTLHIAGSKKGNLFEKESPSLFFICNMQRVRGVITKLKQVVMQSASITRQTRPIRYLEVERKLLLLSTLENVHVIELRQLVEVAKSCGLPTDNEKLLQLIKYSHHIGALLHYHNLPSLSNTIILSPHWLAKLLTYVLTNLACWPREPNLVQCAVKRQKEGLLEEELIDWSVEKFNESESPENRIATDLRGVPVVELFIKFLLIVDVTQSSLAGKKSRGKGKRLFLVPHLLPFEVFPPSKAVSLKFLFYFPGHFIPDNLVHHLIVKCAQWNNDRHYDVLRLSYHWVCLNLGQYQVYEVKPVDQHHYIELTIIPDPAMPPEYEMESYKESRELITAVKGFIDDLMEEHLTAAVEKSPVECYIACPGCDERHIKLESFPSTGHCYCPTKKHFCYLPSTYYKVLSSKGDPTQFIGSVHIPTPDQRPTMRFITKYIIPKIAVWWKDVANFLGYEIKTIELIEEKHPRDCERCCDTLFRDWLSTNHGMGPKTWATLLESLKEIEQLAAVTEDIEAQLKLLGIL